jgi:hypothetical protein
MKAKGLIVDNWRDKLADCDFGLILSPVTWPYGLAMVEILNLTRKHGFAALPIS